MQRFGIPFLLALCVVVGASVSGQGLLNVNLASKNNIEALNGVGPTWADAIVKGRPYKGKDEILNKRIIPENVYNEIKDKIVVRQFSA